MKQLDIQGEKVPRIGLGTWDMRGEAGYRATLSALELGYRHIDTAEMYGNEAEVGRAIADSGLDRADLFLVTKVSASHHSRAGVVQAAEGSLQRLGLEVIDLYLLHRPNDQISIEETMVGMNELVELGKVRKIGVSNFSVRQLEQAQAASSARVFTNQIEYFLGHPQDAMLEYCQSNEVMFTAYSPLDRGRLGGMRDLESIAASQNATAAQVALRWLIQQDNVVAIPKSEHPDRQRENLGVLDFDLSAEEMHRLDSMHR